jgi:CitMHS family citrate-Mg2+:H+ or citrate-Ca2+:H+ symporter
MDPAETLMLIILGYLTIATFMVAIMTRKLSASVALILVPVLYAVVAGHGLDIGGMAIKGLTQLAPVVVVLVFAMLYFGIMIDAGLFDPLVRVVVRMAGGDPRKVAIGTAIVALIVSLDGDGATTAIVTISAFLPVYRRLKMNILILAMLLGLANTIVNIAPWGGPAGRVAAALNIEPAAIFIPLLPTILAGMAATIAIAWWVGGRERARLGVVPFEGDVGRLFPDRDPQAERPRLIWPNFILTLLVIAGAVTHILPLPFLFMIALALALTLNYPRLVEQRERLAGHAANALPIVLLVFAAGVFTGVMEGTGMLEAMARGAVSVVPPSVGPWLGPITAVLSGPFTFVISNDAYYFGVVPVIAQTAAAYGVDPANIARASLLGQPIHGLSPLVAALYLVSGLLKVEVGPLQAYGLKWAVVVTAVMIAVAFATGAIV